MHLSKRKALNFGKPLKNLFYTWLYERNTYKQSNIDISYKSHQYTYMKVLGKYYMTFEISEPKFLFALKQSLRFNKEIT